MNAATCSAALVLASLVLWTPEVSTTSQAPAMSVLRETADVPAIFGPSPPVTPEREPNNTSGTANLPIFQSGPYAIISGAIDPAGDIDFFAFVYLPAGRLWIATDTGGTPTAGATSQDTVIDVLAANGNTVIETDDNDGTGNGGDGTVETPYASLIAGRSVSAGTYFIRVRGVNGSAVINPYRLFVTLTVSSAAPEVEPNDTAATANPIATFSSPIGLRSAAIGAAGDADYYAVAAKVGNIVYFSADADLDREGAGTDLVVEFRDPADVLLLSVDASGTGSLSDPAGEGANFVITADGTYLIRVRHSSAADTGAYHLMAAVLTGISVPIPLMTETDPNGSAATANAIDLATGRGASGAIKPAGDIDFFTFVAAAGSRVWIDADTRGRQDGANSLDSVIDLIAADGTTIVETDDDDGAYAGESATSSLIAGRTLDAGGRYFIRVRASSPVLVINPYLLFVTVTHTPAASEVEPNNTAATANPIVAAGSPMDLRSGVIAVAGDVDYYSVVAKAGDVVYFAADEDPERDGVGTDLVLELHNPADWFIDRIYTGGPGSVSDPTAAGTNYTFGADGTYFIKVGHAGSGTGTYHLMVATATVSSPPFTDDPLTAGVSVVRAVHITELRTRIDALRSRFGLPAFGWTRPSLSGLSVSAVDVTELRSALQQVYASAGMQMPALTDASIISGVTVVKAVHITQLRNAVITLEYG